MLPCCYQWVSFLYRAVSRRVYLVFVLRNGLIVIINARFTKSCDLLSFVNFFSLRGGSKMECHVQSEIDMTNLTGRLRTPKRKSEEAFCLLSSEVLLAQLSPTLLTATKSLLAS